VIALTAPDPSRTPDPLPSPSRDGVLQSLEYIREEVEKSLRSGSMQHPTIEKALNEKARLLIYACQVTAGILKDADLDDIKRRIAALEERRQGRDSPIPDPLTIAGGK